MTAVIVKFKPDFKHVTDNGVAATNGDTDHGNSDDCDQPSAKKIKLDSDSH